MNYGIVIMVTSGIAFDSSVVLFRSYESVSKDRLDRKDKGQLFPSDFGRVNRSAHY